MAAPDAMAQSRAEWGRKGMRSRWGASHGATKCVRAAVATVDRFRAVVPAERDRAAAATAALDAWLDARDDDRITRRTKPITVAAVLARKWYDEIAAGRKTIEYRDICDYWDARLWAPDVRGHIGAIKFSRAYTATNMIWEVVRVDRNEQDGCYEIHLGRRLA